MTTIFAATQFVVASHDDLADLTGGDPHTQYLLVAGRTGGQTVNGGLGASDELVLRGSANPNGGLIRSQAPIVFDETSLALNSYAVSVGFTSTISSAFIGGVFNASPLLTVTNGTFIWEGLRVSPTIRTSVSLVFAGFTMMQGLPTLQAGSVAGQSPLNPLVINAGPRVENEFVGTRTAGLMTGMNWTPHVRSVASGAVMNVTDIVGLNNQPVWNTASGGTIGFGNIRAVWCRLPTVAAFQQDLGTEGMTSYVGLDYDNMASFGGNVTKVAVRSAQAAASNAYFLLQTGNAQSVFNGQVRWDVDLVGVTFGAGQDVSIGWGGAGFLFIQFNALADQLRISNPSADRILFNDATDAAEFNFNCAKFSLGAQTGAVGNQVGVFVTGARATSVAGGWSDFLLTHGGNVTLDHAMTELNAWTVNPLSITNGSGSLTGPVATLNLGGMTTALLAGNDTAALRVTGRHTQRGPVHFEPINPANLTGGVTAWAGLLSDAQSNNGRHWARITCDAATILHGIDATAAQDGDTYCVTNVGSNTLQVNDQSGTETTAANRIVTGTGANINIAADESFLIRYDGTTARWRILFVR